MNRIFLDSVGLLGVWDVDDQWHSAASKAYQAFSAQHRRATTTTFILLECGNAAARAPYRLGVDRIRNVLADDGGLIVSTEQDWRQAWKNYASGEAGAAGIVDQVSFVVMRHLGITDVFSNDRHFQAAGFNTLF